MSFTTEHTRSSAATQDSCRNSCAPGVHSRSQVETANERSKDISQPDTSATIADDEILRQQRAANERRVHAIMTKKPKVLQRKLAEGAIPYRQFRGVTWMDPRDGDYVFDIYLSILGAPTQQRTWASDLPCKLLMEHSSYFEAVLKQQENSERPKVVFSIISGEEEAQVKGLKKLMRFMLRPPLDLTGPVVSKQVFGVESVATEVLLEMVKWAEYLGMKKADDAIENLKEEIERRAFRTQIKKDQTMDHSR